MMAVAGCVFSHLISLQCFGHILDKYQIQIKKDKLDKCWIDTGQALDKSEILGVGSKLGYYR